MNKVIFIGNLTKDPEISETTNGVKVCKFTLAVKRKFADESDFINIVVWRGLAENCHKYLKKGNKVGVVGSLQIRIFDGQDGTKKYITEVNAEEVEFLITTKVNETEEKPAEMQPVEDDNLPF